jgi:hypothetical protein
MSALRKSTLTSTWFRSILLIATFFLLAFLFVSPAVRYAEEAAIRDSNRAPNSPIAEMKLDELIKAEHQKAIDEIKLRLEHQDSWYHYKFLILGGVLAIFLGQTGLSRERNSAPVDRYRKLKRILTADSNYAILVIACVIALVIDMHIRSNMFGMQTIGLWIANYVEPSYPLSGYYPWEQFLRNPNSPSLHLDSLYKLSFTIHLHFLTSIIYLIYAIVLQQICLTFNIRDGLGRKQIIIFGSLLVHLSLLAFVFVAHAVPSAYKMNLIPFGLWESGWKNVGYYIIPWLLIIIFNIPYLLLIRNTESK